MKLLIKILLVVAVVISVSSCCYWERKEAKKQSLRYFIHNTTNEEIQIKTENNIDLPIQIFPDKERYIGRVYLMDFNAIADIIPKD